MGKTRKRPSINLDWFGSEWLKESSPEYLRCNGFERLVLAHIRTRPSFLLTGTHSERIDELTKYVNNRLKLDGPKELEPTKRPVIEGVFQRIVENGWCRNGASDSEGGGLTELGHSALEGKQESSPTIQTPEQARMVICKLLYHVKNESLGVLLGDPRVWGVWLQCDLELWARNLGVADELVEDALASLQSTGFVVPDRWGRYRITDIGERFYSGLPAVAETEWFTVSEAAALYEEFMRASAESAKVQVSRSCSKNEFMHNGLERADRRIQRESFIVWLFEAYRRKLHRETLQ